MAKTRTYETIFTRVTMCSDEACGWIRVPTAPDPVRQFEVCPSCGAELKSTVGQFRIEEPIGFFSSAEKKTDAFRHRGGAWIKLSKATPPKP